MADKDIPERHRIVLMYLGRRGALGRFSLELCQAAARERRYEVEIIISSNNQIAADFANSGVVVTQVPTFERASSPSVALAFPATRDRILEILSERRPMAVVSLMPHVWSPVLARAIRKLGIKYISIIHDADAHPGDRTGWVTRWLLQDARNSDLVITLSRAVASRLVGQGLVAADRVLPLFHPDLRYGSVPAQRTIDPEREFRLLLFGRIMAYKGLPLLLDALELLQAKGHKFHLGVIGSGNLKEVRSRLADIGAEVVNRWIDDNEIGGILARYDAMICSHIEASQSGVASMAFGACMPVVAMPVGGLAEQIIDGQTGILARRSSAGALAEGILRLSNNPTLYDAISRRLSATAGERSMDRFLAEIMTDAELLYAGRAATGRELH
jgi:glycosyltransferase involved in cell wall biosynthesis